MQVQNLSCNWKKLKGFLHDEEKSTKVKPPRDSRKQHGLKRKRTGEYQLELRNTQSRLFKRRKFSSNLPLMGSERSDPQRAVPNETNDAESEAISSKNGSAPNNVNEGLFPAAKVGKYVAIDCEMVGVGPNPEKESALARVSAVNFLGELVYDSYVRPKEEVTDWRTHVSGIQPKHMIKARSLEQVQRDIASLVNGKIWVGHAVRNDLDVLMLSHPKRDIRDTARHLPFRKLAGGGSPKLKILASQVLGIDIQHGEHSSIEDARACMLLFRQEKDAFEAEHLKIWPIIPNLSMAANGAKEEKVNRKKNKKRKKKGR